MGLRWSLEAAMEALEGDRSREEGQERKRGMGTDDVEVGCELLRDDPGLILVTRLMCQVDELGMKHGILSWRFGSNC